MKEMKNCRKNRQRRRSERRRKAEPVSYFIAKEKSPPSFAREAYGADEGT